MTTFRSVLRLLVAALRAMGCAPEPETTLDNPPSLVVTAPVEERSFSLTIAVEGTVVPRRRVDIPAQVTGRLRSVAVREGDPVVAGKTVLFVTDAAEFERARDLAEAAVRVAALSVAERTANLARVSAEHLQAERDFERYERLYTRDYAVSKAAYEEVQAHLAQAAAARTHAEAVLELEKGNERQAQLERAVAERRLGEATVLAPHTGTVSSRHREAGEWADAGETVVTVVDTSALEIRTALPTRYWPAILPGTTEAAATVEGTTNRLLVSAKSPTADPESRTFTVTLAAGGYETPPVPGALATVQFSLEQRTALAAPEDAILGQDEETAVFLVRDGTAACVRVRTGQREDRFVEITAGEVAAGDSVIVRGHTLLADGDPVRTAEERSAPDVS